MCRGGTEAASEKHDPDQTGRPVINISRKYACVLFERICSRSCSIRSGSSNPCFDAGISTWKKSENTFMKRNNCTVSNIVKNTQKRLEVEQPQFPTLKKSQQVDRLAGNNARTKVQFAKRLELFDSMDV